MTQLICRLLFLSFFSILSSCANSLPSGNAKQVLSEDFREELPQWRMQLFENPAARRVLQYRVAKYLQKQRGNVLLHHEDLTQVALLGLYYAARDFDPNAGKKFEWYADQRIRSELGHEIRRQSDLKRGLHDHLPRYLNARNTLYVKLRREPTSEEIATQMQLSAAVVRRLEWNLTAIASLQQKPVDPHGKLIDMEYADPQAPYEEKLEVLDLIRQLDPLERAVVVGTVWRGYSQRELGAQLGKGQATMSRALSSAKQKLRTAVEASRAL